MKILDFIKKDFNLFEIFKGSSVAMVFKVIGIGIGYVFFIYLSRVFGKEVVGLFSICWSILMIAAVVGKLGLDTSIVKFISQAFADNNYNELLFARKKGLETVFYSSLAVSILVFIFSKFISHNFLEKFDHPLYIQILAIGIVPLSIMGFNAETTRGLKKIGIYSIFQNSSILLLNLFIIAIISYLHNGEKYIIHSMVLSTMILMVLSFVFTQKSMNKIKSGGFTEKKNTLDLKKIIDVSFPMLLTNSLYLVLNWTDLLMIGHFMTEGDAGVYNIAVKVAALNLIGLSAINTIAAPKFSELHAQNDIKGLRKMVKQITLINILITLPVILAIFIVPEFLLSLFGDEFIDGKGPLFILAIGQFLSASSGSTMYVLNMTGKEKTGRNIIVFGTVLNLVLNYFMIPVYGLMGAAVSTAISTVVWKLLSVFYIYKFYKFYTFPYKING